MTKPFEYIGNGLCLDEGAAWEYIHKGYLLSPRTVLKGRSKHPQPIHPLKFDPANIPSYVQKALESSIRQTEGPCRAVMFTGGFDSLLMCMLTQRYELSVKAVTIRFDDFNPNTVQKAIDLAHQVDIEHQIISVDVSEYLSAFDSIFEILDEPLLDLDLPIVYAALKKYDRRLGGDVFISGMGCDQWFGDLALKDEPEGLAVRLERAIIDETAHQKVAQAHGCKFIFPFLTNEMLAVSQSIPASMKKDKNMLRAMAVVNNIPSRGSRTEIQIPGMMRRLILKVYGNKAWPHPVKDPGDSNRVNDQTLRQIVLGLWLEKAQKKIIA